MFFREENHNRLVWRNTGRYGGRRAPQTRPRFAAFAIFSIAGGHWAVLQTIAWAEMLRDYTQKTGSVAKAVEETFDGQHPCEICKQIAVAKQQEAKTQDEKQIWSKNRGVWLFPLRLHFMTQT